MTAKYTILKASEMTPILDWLNNYDKTEVAKELKCTRRTLNRHLSYDSSVLGWKFPTERLEKLKQLMK